MARYCPVSFQACGEPWEVCEGFDFTSTREEMKIVKAKVDLYRSFNKRKWLKEIWLF
jgi:hypothetical protein